MVLYFAVFEHLVHDFLRQRHVRFINDAIVVVSRGHTTVPEIKLNNVGRLKAYLAKAKQEKYELICRKRKGKLKGCLSICLFERKSGGLPGLRVFGQG
jgi:hypothetical protein